MSPTIIPIVIVPLTFLFVLLIILIVKAPKAGACAAGGLLLLAPMFLWRFAATGALAHEEAIPLFVVPITFLFVLLVILLAKAPKVGAGLIVAIVVMVVLGLFLAPVMSHRMAATPAPSATVWAPLTESAGSDTALVAISEDQQVSLGLHEPVVHPPAPSWPPAPIWSEGVERQFDAQIYPSKLAAVQAVGWQMDKTVRKLTEDANAPAQITLFQEVSEPALIAALRDAIQQAVPQATCTIEADLRNLRPSEVGVTIQFSGMQTQPAPWAPSSETRVIDGTLHVHIFTMGARVMAQRQFVEMPWAENFASFASTRPEQHFIVARSREICMTESESRQQALEDARARLTEALGRHAAPKLAKLSAPAITLDDVRQGGFVVDQFTQSFDGSAGKIWRQALLIDVSGPRLAQLAQQKDREARSTRMSWARMGFSTIGVLVLIGAIYFFLNMATRGYYEWSLRIAGVVLAIVAIVSILMIVQ